jgi:hypothetical protein
LGRTLQQIGEARREEEDDAETEQYREQRLSRVADHPLQAGEAGRIPHQRSPSVTDLQRRFRGAGILV